ncbi:MAG: hypothetical protein CMM26_04000 [Rhodospirillaceae bacterium]|nr:hypothetical protein [Rhodospirillaceae bacterium]
MTFWRVLFLLSGLAILMPLVIDIFLPSMPAIAASYGVETGEVQLTLASLNLGAALGQVIYGPLADRFGRRFVIVWTMAVFTAAGLASANPPSMEWMNALRFLQGLTAASGMIIIRAIVRDLYDGAQSTKMLAYTFVTGSTMPVAAPIVGGFITVTLGWQINMYIIGCTGLLVMLILWFWLEETGEPDASALNIGTMMKAYAELLRSKQYLTYAFVGLGPFAGLFAILTALSSILIEFMGVSPDTFGLLFAAVMAGNLVASWIAGRWAETLGDTRLIVWGSLVCLISGVAALLVVLSGLSSPTGIVLPSLGYMVGFALLIPAATAGAMSPFPHIAGRASSLIGLVHYGAGAAASLVLGLIADGTDRPLSYALAVCGVLSLIAIFPVLATKEK